MNFNLILSKTYDKNDDIEKHLKYFSIPSCVRD